MSIQASLLCPPSVHAVFMDQQGDKDGPDSAHEILHENR